MVRMSRLLGTTAAFVVLAHAVLQNPEGYVVHEETGLSGEPSSHGWIRSRQLEASSILPVRIGLTQLNLEKGHELLMEVSHPDSPKYSQWWSAEDVYDFFAPSTETVETVKHWITSMGIAEERIVHSENKGWLAIDTTVAEAEQLFQTTFHEYTNNRIDDKLKIGTDKYYVPEHVARHIDYVKPGVVLVSAHKRNIAARGQDIKQALKRRGADMFHVPLNKDLLEAQGSQGDNVGSTGPQSALDHSLINCTHFMTMACYRALYGIPETPLAVQGYSLGVLEVGDYFDQPDLDLSYRYSARWVPNGTQPIPALIDGAQYNSHQNDTDGVQGEALMDLLVAISLIYPQNVTLYQVDDPIWAGNPNVTSFASFLDALDGSYCTSSVSGQTGKSPYPEPIYPNPDPKGYQGEAGQPANYQKRRCYEFLKLGLMGTTILMSSGDAGVQVVEGEVTASGCLGPKNEIFTIATPANCPYCTVVGGTRHYLNQTILDPESVMVGTPDDGFSGYNFTSGGGFSFIFARPDYQDVAVQTYLDHHVPPYPYYEQLEPDFNTVHGLYNRIGRATPDVSANGARLVYFQQGEAYLDFGTSVSTPVFASVITLLNQERALAGKASAGFVNPVLYSHPEMFHDIVNGSNVGCGTGGFPASPGWDASTGLGTPIYEKMREVFLALP